MLVNMPANDRFIRTNGTSSYLSTTTQMHLLSGAKKIEAFLDFSFHDVAAFPSNGVGPLANWKHLWGTDTQGISLWQFYVESDLRPAFRVFRYTAADDTGITVVCSVKAPAANALEMNARYRLWGYDDGEGNLTLRINGSVVNTATYVAAGRMVMSDDSLEMGRGNVATGYFVNIAWWDAWVAYDDILRFHTRPRYRQNEDAPDAHLLATVLPEGGTAYDISGYHIPASIVGKQSLPGIYVDAALTDAELPKWYAGSSWAPGGS